MTTRFSRCSLIFFAMSSWVSAEQLKRLFSASTTWGRLRAYLVTSSTLITPAMLIPQEQTKTPMRLSSPATLRSAG